jgi:hypothetical protein
MLAMRIVGGMCEENSDGRNGESRPRRERISMLLESKRHRKIR